MAALTASRNTAQWGSIMALELRALPMKAATKCYAGGIVVSDAGYAAPGRTATGLIAAGVARKDWDNSTGGAGAITMTIQPGIFKLANSTAGDLIAQTNFGALCYIVDDNTVALTSGGSTRSVAGMIEGVDSDGGVWVQVGLRAANGS